MAEGNCSPVYVDLAAIETQLFFDGQILACEGLIDLDQIDIFQLQPGFLERQPRGRNRAAAHDLWIDAGDAPADDAAHGLEAALFRLRQSGHDNGSATVHDTAGISRRDSSVLPTTPFQPSQPSHRS